MANRERFSRNTWFGRESAADMSAKKRIGEAESLGMIWMGCPPREQGGGCERCESELRGRRRTLGVPSDRRFKRRIFPNRCTLALQILGPCLRISALDMSHVALLSESGCRVKVWSRHPIKLDVFQAAQQSCFLNVASVCARII